MCEVLQTGWHQSRPSGNTICSADSSLGAAGFPVTIISGASHPDNDFGNNKLFRLIILTCSETTQTLVQSLVDTDGDFTTLGDQKTTIGPTPPSLGSESEAALQQYLCNLGGAQYNNLQADDYTKTTRIPKP